MKSLFARVLKVAAPYTLCGALGVVALAGEATAQIAPECLEEGFSMHARVNAVQEKRLNFKNEFNVPNWVRTYVGNQASFYIDRYTNDKDGGAYLNASLLAVNHLPKFDLKKQLYNYFSVGGWFLDKDAAIPNIFIHWLPSFVSDDTRKVTKCTITRDSKTGVIKTAKFGFTSDNEKGGVGEIAVTLRPPKKLDDLRQIYEVAKVEYSGGNKGTGIPGVKAVVALPPHTSPAYSSHQHGGTLVAQTDLVRAQFTNTELNLLKNLKNYYANLLKKELEKTNAPQYTFVQSDFKQLAHQSKFVNRIPSDGTEDDRIDAVYHVGMQAYLTVTTGINNAKDLGDLWELKDVPGSFINGVWMIPTGNDYNFFLASNKDFHNNRVGRNLGTQLLNKGFASLPKGNDAQRQVLAEKCIDEALKLVLKAPANWKPGQTSGIVIRERDPNVPTYVDPSNGTISAVVKLWKLSSLMSDNVLSPFFRQLRGIFGL